MIINQNNLVSMDALLIFMRTAERLNFTHTARDLGVTQAAISRRIKSLEASLGSRLFIRTNKRKLVLTRDGSKLFQAATTSLSLLDSVVREIRDVDRKDSITITTTTGFANQWLMKRLSGFNQIHSDINVRAGSRRC